jgi:hypothetical protein
MAEMKYVVVESEAGEQLFTFPKNISHSAFAETLNHIRHENGRAWRRVHKEPISAGFVQGGHCYGESETLKLQSRPEDTELLRNGGFKPAH